MLRTMNDFEDYSIRIKAEMPMRFQSDSAINVRATILPLKKWL